MKKMKEFDYTTFKLKDEAKSRRKHAHTIQRMDERGIEFHDIIEDDSIVENIVCGIVGSPMFSYGWPRREWDEKGKTQANINRWKRQVNGVMRNYIEKCLAYEGLPKSWATAFYLRYKERIDGIMAEATRDIIDDYLPPKEETLTAYDA